MDESNPFKDLMCTSVFIIRGNAALMGLRHYKESEWKTISVWTTPGGKCGYGEPAEAGLRRETEEETGITELIGLEYIGEVPGASGRGEKVSVYLAASSQEPQNREPEKFSEWRFMPLDAVPENFINPAGLALVKARLDRKS